MSVGIRLREERLRLKLSQPAFAALAGVTKGALVKWEKDTASPNAAALIAFADAGADAIYILTGKRLPASGNPVDAMTREDLDEIERELIDPARVRRSDETEEQVEFRVIASAVSRLTGILEHEVKAGLPSQLVERAEALLDVARDPRRLSLLRAADFAQARKLREDEQELLAIWLEGWPYQPDHAVIEAMARIALEHGVPHKTLVELSHQIYTDLEEQRSAESIIRLHEQEAAKSKVT